MRQQMAELIERSHSIDERSRYLGFEPARDVLNEIAAIGKEILDHIPHVPGACAWMAAIWVNMVQSRKNYPVYLVAGDLYVRGIRSFGNESCDIAATFERGDVSWDGHCWVVCGDYVCELSLFRTAYSGKGPLGLMEAVIDIFGERRGLWIATANEFDSNGFRYIPKYVATADQIIGLANGGRVIIDRLFPRPTT